MTREEEIIKASREYAMNKSNENNTCFVDYKDIEEAFLEGAKFAFAYSETIDILPPLKRVGFLDASV